MSDDIVTRLRDIEHLQFKPRHSWQDVVGEAADEIERLRKAVNNLAIDLASEICGLDSFSDVLDEVIANAMGEENCE